MTDTNTYFKKVSDNVFQLTLKQRGPVAWQVPNSFIIGNGDEAVLIDADYPLPEAKENTLACLRSLGQDTTLTNLFLSHAHPDHIGGAMSLKKECGLNIHIHANEREYVETKGVEIDSELVDDQTYSIAGDKLRMVFTPGHSPGHVCFYLEKARALFTADTVLGKGTSVVVPPFGNMIDYLASLDKLLKLDLDVIYPGHGDPITKPREKLTEYIEHRAEREKQVIELLKEGLTTPAQMVPRIYVGYHKSVLAAAAKSVQAQLEKLETEKRAEADKDGNYHLT